jgi:hypothetical protein
MNKYLRNFDKQRAILLYGVAVKERLDFSPLALKLFRYRGLSREMIEWLNCARWVKNAGMKLTEADQRKLEYLHDRIVGKPNGDGGPPARVQEATASSDDTDDGGSDGAELTVADLIRAAHTDEDDEEAKPSPIRPVQEPTPVPPVAAAEPEETTTKPAGGLAKWLSRKGSGPEIG